MKNSLNKRFDYAEQLRNEIEDHKFRIALLSEEKQKMEILSGYKSGIDYILPLPIDARRLVNILIDTEIHFTQKLQKRILVVDDSLTVRHSVSRELKETGFQTMFAENGKKAVEITVLEKPDLVITDINMPVMDGYAACKTLKQNKNTTP